VRKMKVAMMEKEVGGSEKCALEEMVRIVEL
jgi:hypothetical protein